MTGQNITVVLLIIDAQVNMLSGDSAVPSASTTSANIECVLTAARTAQPRPMIIHIRNNGDSGDPDEPNTPGWELAVLPEPSEHVIDKWENNAFARTGLAQLVPENAHVTVVGLQSEFCIRATSTGKIGLSSIVGYAHRWSSCLARGNKVALVRGAHATYDLADPDPGNEVKGAEQMSRDIELELEKRGVKLIEVGDVTF